MIDKGLMEKISNKARKSVEPLIERWQKFARKVTARSAEVKAEAEAGLDEIIGMNPLDPNPISSAFSSVEARFRGLSTKADQAVEKLEEEWDEAADDLDLKEKERERVSRLWSQLLREKDRLCMKLEQDGHQVEATKGSDWARKLYDLAQQEMAKPVNCPSCGAPLEARARYATASEKCPHCGSVNEIAVGMATGYYFQGMGVHNLSQEAALPQWTAMQEAEHEFNELRHPSSEDKQKYLGAVRAHWTTYYETFTKLNPAHPRSVQESVNDKLAHYTTTVWDGGADQAEQSAVSAALQLVASGNEKGVYEFLKKNTQLDIDDLVVAVHERGDRKGAKFLLALEYELEKNMVIITITPQGVTIGSNEPFEKWRKERLHELDHDLANR